MVRNEKPLLEKLLVELKDRAKDVQNKVAVLAQRVEQDMSKDVELQDDRASFLGAKHTLLLCYCLELCFYAASKGRGVALERKGSVERLLQLRTVMEKLRPLDRKLKYQTDKLLKIASACTSYCHIGDEDYKTSEKEEEGEEGDENPLSFMPRPEVMSQFGQGADFSGNMPAQGADGAKMGLFRAPRMSSVPYDEDGLHKGTAARNRRLEKRRNKLSRGEVMETLREEFGDHPETVRAVSNAGTSGVSEARMKIVQEEDKKQLSFEEEHMVRLTITRKAKKARKEVEKYAGRLESIADIGSATNFLRVAKDADGFGDEKGGEDGAFNVCRGGNDTGKRGTGGTLRRAMGAVGGSVSAWEPSGKKRSHR